MARRGLLESQQAGSRLTEAIAHMRLGHAYQLVAAHDPMAEDHYQQALDLIQATGVARTRAEAYLGITLIHGHRGDLAAAQDSAQMGLALAESAGDEWVAALLWLALGSSAVISADPQAEIWLEHARQRFRRGGDTYGQALVALWCVLDHLHAGHTTAAAPELINLLDAIERHGYIGLLTSSTLFGPRDLTILLPLLLLGRTSPIRGTHQAAMAERILRLAYPTIAADEIVDTYHPGYTLRIQMLGGFRVWRGTTEIQSREWQREKSRQLLQLLINYRGQWIQREQICAWLWPESDSNAAERQFKVTLNALNVAIEPRRPPRTPPFFIRRQGLAYSFAPSYGCWIDVDEFDLRLASVLQTEPELALRNSRTAIQLYRGDYLPELLYESWAFEERERLLARYLSAATDLANRFVQHGALPEAIACCEQVIRRDRCYEEAYQVLMQAHARSGSRSQAIRAYTRCAQTLTTELGIEPLPETTLLYQRICRNDPV
jgi:DNA-binding SARP family transcriptional activator